MSGSDLDLFDTEFAVNQFSGDQALLMKILEKFIQQYLHFDTLLAQLMQQNDIPAAKQQVHTMKGVCGNLGMKALYNACIAFEGDLLNQTTESNLKNILQVFRKTLTSVQHYSAKSGTE